MGFSGKRAVILVAEGVEDLECQVTAMRLVEEGVDVQLAGIGIEPIKGKEGLSIKPTMTINDLEAGISTASYWLEAGRLISCGVTPRFSISFVKWTPMAR